MERALDCRQVLDCGDRGGGVVAALDRARRGGRSEHDNPGSEAKAVTALRLSPQSKTLACSWRAPTLF